MTDKIHVSLDTETWGKRPGCDGRSIGAMQFNPYRRQDTVSGYGIPTDTAIGETFYLAVDNPLAQNYPTDKNWSEQHMASLHGDHRKYRGLHRDPETVNWWFDQSAEAQAAFANPVDLREGLERLTAWMQSIGVDPEKDNTCIWSHGAAYDPPIVIEWYHAVGLPVPWFYRAPRDTRTAFDMVAVGNHSAWLRKYSQGIKHHALDDAHTQALAITAAHQRLVY